MQLAELQLGSCNRQDEYGASEYEVLKSRLALLFACDGPHSEANTFMHVGVGVAKAEDQDGSFA